MDIILIEELKILCIIGLLPHEREVPQYVHLDVRIFIPQILHEDELSGSVDYVSIASWMEKFLQKKQFLTLEKACQELIEGIFLRWTIVGKVELTLRKPAASSNARAVGVHMTRARVPPESGRRFCA